MPRDLTIEPLYIFDLDGTLALNAHRQHFVEGKEKDWESFFAACVDDLPNIPVIQTYWQLVAANCEVRIWSGRSEAVRRETEVWLAKHVFELPLEEVPSFVLDEIRMRAVGNHEPDAKLKKRWLSGMAPLERERLVAVFDDRDVVVDMWRREGVACFQVARGEF